MKNVINIDEIIIVNSTGIVCLLFLIASKLVNKTTKRVGEYLLNAMIVFTIGNLAMEITTFLIDGLPGRGIHVLQYIVNALLIFGATMTGYLWCLFVEFKIRHSLKWVHRIAVVLAIPVVCNFIFVVLDCFGAGLLFSVSEKNVYTRGNFAWLSYIYICLYFLYSIVVVYVAKHKGNQIQFFPVYTFVLPCVLGTIVQAVKYGVATGWFSVVIAILLLEMQLQREESFVDELSGLYNRKYLEFFYKQVRMKKDTQVYGIMMDLNLFKKINDTYGHTVGDDAIRTVSRLLSQWAEITDTVIRFAGDEFIILCLDRSQDEVTAFMERIRENLIAYNETEKKPYELSFSMGCAKHTGENQNLDDFLRDMDQMMYQDKEKFRRTLYR